MLTKLLLTALLLLVPVASWAAAIDHTFVEQNTPQTSTSATYVDITGAAITSGNFSAGKKYFISVTAHVNENSTGELGIQTVHGSTAFAESEQILNLAVSTDYAVYAFQTVWTAVASEGIKLQFKTSAGTVAADQIALMKINLSDNLTENTDWFFAERATDDALSTTPVDGASVTFTPSAASNWVVLSYAQVDITSTTSSPISRIERSGEATSALPEARVRFGATTVVTGFGLLRPFALTNASNTFKEVSLAGATAHTRLHSSIFALNLSKFRTNQIAYTEADEALSATDYATTLQTLSITPTVASDVWILSYWGADINDTAREVETRIQVDGADQPSGQTTDNYQFRAAQTSLSDETPMTQQTMVTNMTAAAHTIDLDGSADSITAAPTGQYRSVVAVTMELAAARPSGRPIFLE